MESLIYLFILGLTLSMFKIHSSENKDESFVIGKFTIDEWFKATGWKIDYNNYKPNNEIIEKLKIKINNDKIKIYVFAGSWCEDTHSELPKIATILRACNKNLDLVEIYGMDREKKEPNGIPSNYNIIKVPTLIVLYDSNEIGRIIEFPKTGSNWELDLLSIVQ